MSRSRAPVVPANQDGFGVKDRNAKMRLADGTGPKPDSAFGYPQPVINP